MTPMILYAALLVAYLVLVAAGVARTRVRGLPAGVRVLTAALQVLLVPLALAVMLYLGRDEFQIAGAGWMLAIMAGSGMVVAAATDVVLRLRARAG